MKLNEKIIPNKMFEFLKIDTIYKKYRFIMWNKILEFLYIGEVFRIEKTFEHSILKNNYRENIRLDLIRKNE